MYIKGSILLSRVKSFNLRFRAKLYLGDPAYTFSPTYTEVWEKSSDEALDVATDPRRTSGFIEIDHIASMFRQSFPLHLRSPIHDGRVDSHLYTASLVPHLCANCSFLRGAIFDYRLFIAPSSYCTILMLMSLVPVVCPLSKSWRHLDISLS